MASMTLLELVQDILSDMDSDEVNSITDTIEATQVASIIKTTFFNIIDGRDWPHLYQFFKLVASGSSVRPTHMSLPSNVMDIRYIKYNKIELAGTFNKYTNIIYKTPEEFMELVDGRHSDSTNILSVSDPTGIILNIINDTPPTYYTSFDNENIIMDSYDSAVDTTLQTAKTQAYGKVYPTWTMSNSFVPDLPLESFSYLLNEAKSIAFIALKQMPNPKAEQHSITQRRRMSQQAWRVTNGINIPNYGRKV